jgi:hypothetical protein
VGVSSDDTSGGGVVEVDVVDGEVDGRVRGRDGGGRDVGGRDDKGTDGGGRDGGGRMDDFDEVALEGL